VRVLADNSGTDRREVVLALRCYAFGSGDSWEAICVDFDMAVSGPSPEDVRSSLEICLEMYLEEAAGATPGERRYLLNRRSPWFVRAHLRCRAACRCVGVREFRRFTLRQRIPALG